MSNDRITEADIRLFVSLIRFDEAYIVYFKTSRKAVREYPNMLNYLRELYQFPDVAATVNFDHIRRFYFTAQPQLNFYRYFKRLLSFFFFHVHYEVSSRSVRIRRKSSLSYTTGRASAVPTSSLIQNRGVILPLHSSQQLAFITLLRGFLNSPLLSCSYRKTTVSSSRHYNITNPGPL